MGVRETVNRHPKVALGGAIVTFALVAGWAALSGGVGGTRGTQSSALDRAFYSVDDGARWFTDARDSATGKPFVAYLERLAQVGHTRSTTGVSVTDAIEVKRPGDSEWVKPSSPKGIAAMTPKCPSDAAGPLQPLLP